MWPLSTINGLCRLEPRLSKCLAGVEKKGNSAWTCEMQEFEPPTIFHAKILLMGMGYVCMIAWVHGNCLLCKGGSLTQL